MDSVVHGVAKSVVTERLSFHLFVAEDVQVISCDFQLHFTGNSLEVTG